MIFLIVVIILSILIIVLDSTQEHFNSCKSNANTIPNLIQIKTNKTGGTTLSGIVRRIGSFYNLNGIDTNDLSVFNQEPMIWAFHNYYSKMKPYIGKLKNPYLLITSVREPSRRSYSEYYHIAISRKKQKDTLENKIKYMNRQINSVCKYISDGNYQDVDNIISMYDFILVMDRYNESLVVLADLLKIPINMVWYVKSKDSRNFKVDDTGAKFIPGDYDNESQEFYSYVSDKFMPNNRYDYELYQKANRKLDTHINTMGDRFYILLKQLESDLAMIKDKCCDCIKNAHNDVNMDSYKDDIGICHSCLDNILKE